MKRLISLLGFILIAAIGTFLLLPYVLSSETIRESIAEQLENSTGREVKIAGKAELSVFPTVSMRLAGVSIGGAPGSGDGEPLIAMDELAASMKLMPLLSGTVEIDRFELVRPRVNLVVDARGRSNWKLDPAPQKAGSQAGGGAGQGGSGEAAAAPDADNGSTFAVRAVQIGEFVIHDGQVNYRNAGSGQAIAASSINGTMTWPSLTSAMKANGDLVWRGEVVRFALRVDDPVSLVSGGSSRSNVMVSGSRGKVDASGLVSTAVDFAVDGEISLQVPSLRALARWFDIELPPGDGLKDLTLKSKFLAGGTKFSFPEAVLGLDGNSAEGAIVIKLGPQRPMFQATLAASTLNLTPYLPAPAGNAEAGTAPSAQASSAAAAPGATPQPAGAAKGPDAMAGLGAVDADLRLSAAKTIIGKVELGSGALTAALKGGVLTAQFADLQAFGGRIDGTLGVDGRGALAIMSVDLVAEGISLQPLLTQTLGYSGLSGTGRIAADLGARGASRQNIIQALQGTVSFAASNGAVQGINLVEAVRALRGGKLGNLLTGAAGGETRFTAITSDYRIENGVARTNNMTVEGPDLAMTGAGHANLVTQMLDFRMRARILDSGTVLPSGEKAVLVDLPIIIKGPWQKPLVLPGALGIDEVSPEIEKVIRDVGEKLDKEDINKIGDAIRNGNINDVLNALTGK
jgi:AsmA protein